VLAAGISTFELARLMGSSVQMIELTYGHLARDSEGQIRAREGLAALDRPLSRDFSSPSYRRALAAIEADLRRAGAPTKCRGNLAVAR